MERLADGKTSQEFPSWPPLVVTGDFQMSVSVIIVNWNSGNLLTECLRHLNLQTVLPERVFVVDNASTDGSGDIVDTSGRI